MSKLLVERNSQRNIVRATGVARMAVAKLAKKALSTCPIVSELTSEPTELYFVDHSQGRSFEGRVVSSAFIGLFHREEKYYPHSSLLDQTTSFFCLLNAVALAAAPGTRW